MYLTDPSGLPLVLYHGTMVEIAEFDPAAMRREGRRTTLNTGVFLTTDPSFASGYANDVGGNVLPVFVKSKKTFDWRNPEHIAIALSSYEERYGEPMDKSYSTQLISKGWWASIEGGVAERLMTKHGFDAIWMTEAGKENLLVRSGNQIISAISSPFAKRHNATAKKYKAAQEAIRNAEHCGVSISLI